MATDRLYLKSRWTARKESVDKCVLRALGCLERLANCDEVFMPPWFKCGRSFNDAKQNKIELTFDSFRELFIEGCTRSDFCNEVIDEMGFTVGRLWNGVDGQAATHVSMTCGAYPSPEVLSAANDFCIEYPIGGHALERLLKPDIYYKIMEIVVTSFDPDWARISSDKLHGEVYPGTYHGQAVGWLTYISDRYGSMPELPNEYKLSRIDNNGNIIEIITNKLPVFLDRENIKAMFNLSNILEQKRMLSPIPPFSA